MTDRGSQDEPITPAPAGDASPSPGAGPPPSIQYATVAPPPPQAGPILFATAGAVVVAAVTLVGLSVAAAAIFLNTVPFEGSPDDDQRARARLLGLLWLIVAVAGPVVLILTRRRRRGWTLFARAAVPTALIAACVVGLLAGLCYLNV